MNHIHIITAYLLDLMSKANRVMLPEEQLMEAI